MENKREEIENNYEVVEFNHIVIQKILNKYCYKTWLMMQAKGGFKKECKDKIITFEFPYSYNEFKEESYSECCLIYCETVDSYDVDHENEYGEKVKFTTWLYQKLRDLEPRLWRACSHGSTSNDDYLDFGKGADFEETIDFQLSLSENAKDLLELLESGKGFSVTEKSERAYQWHMGSRNFWESFIRNDSSKNVTFFQFQKAWDEIKDSFNEIEDNEIVYQLVSNE